MGCIALFGSTVATASYADEPARTFGVGVGGGYGWDAIYVTGGNASASATREEDEAFILIQKHPKFPELGATKPEAEATCEHQRGQWLDQGAKLGCKIRGEILFACTVAEDATMSACTRYKLGADLTDERDTIAESNGRPTSVAAGARGFRVYTWATPSKTITLTAYPAGVIVTEAKVAEDVTPDAAPDAPL